MRTRSRFLCAGVALIVGLGACVPAQPEPEPRGDRVSLVVLLAVDQMRADYLTRFRPLFSGGLARMLDEGAVFADAHHEHSMTATAPGHASLSTGLEPARNGIVGNNWFDPARGVRVYSAGPAGSRSPVYLEGTALGDWIKAADPRSKVFTASAKDRSAVMLGGQAPDGAYWYDGNTGSWVSSDHYPDADREWLAAFNAERRLDRLFGSLWTPLEDIEVDESFKVMPADAGLFRHGGVHAIGGMSLEPAAGFYDSIYDTPFVDAHLADLGEAIVRGEELGADGSPDLLALSFSSLDTVGHDYGPDSPEVLDVLLRLDRRLGELLDFLDREVGAEHLLIGFSSDHGVQRLPELQRAEGMAARRIDGRDVVCVQRVGQAVGERLGAEGWYLQTYNGLYLDSAALEAIGADRREVETLLAGELERCEAIRKAWTSAELMADEGVGSEWRRFKNNYFPGRSPDLTLQLEPYYLDDAGMGTTHGSVYDYDSHVPLLFYGRGVAATTVQERVATVDLAPTLATLIGVETPEGLDGRNLGGLLESAEGW